MKKRSTKKKSIFIVFWGSFLWSMSSISAEEPRVLAIGEQKSFSIEAGTRFSLGNAEVIQVKQTVTKAGRPLLVVRGKAQGYSDLLLLGGEGGSNKSLSFRVVSKRQRAITTEGERLFLPSSGVKLTPQGNGWLARGQARTLEEWNLLHSLQANTKGGVQNFVKIHPLERLRAESMIRNRLEWMGISHVKVKGVGSLVLLEGDVDSLPQKELALSIAKEVYRDVRSHLQVPFEQVDGLYFHAKIMELNRVEASQMGLDWSAAIPNAIQLSTKFAKATLGLEAALQLLEKRGVAKVLSKPILIVNEKGVAELKVGGEIPIPLQTKNQLKVQWKPYGFHLRIELPGVSSQQAQAKILVELSSLDAANSREGVPGIKSSRMETLVNLRIGKPILLSGLMESRSNNAERGIPFLSSIPVLGELFQSNDFMENRSELVIYLEARKR